MVLITFRVYVDLLKNYYNLGEMLSHKFTTFFWINNLFGKTLPRAAYQTDTIFNIYISFLKYVLLYWILFT